MGLFRFFRNENKTSSAAKAKERLQVIIAHERGALDRPDYLPQLQRDLLEVIKKYVEISEDKLDIKIDCVDGLSTLEVNVELPDKDS